MPSLRELHEAAQPAPWEQDGDYVNLSTDDSIIGMVAKCWNEADAALIAAMRNNWERMLDVVDAARRASTGTHYEDELWSDLADLRDKVNAFDEATQ